MKGCTCLVGAILQTYFNPETITRTDYVMNVIDGKFYMEENY